MGGLVLALGVAFGVGLLAERVGWLRPKAAWAAALVGGIPLGVGGLPAALAVVYLVVLGSLASRANPRSQDRMGRTAGQVLANGLPAALGLLWGSPVFFLSALAAAAADTLATEVGGRARRAWHLLRGWVPAGTNAAVSLQGSLALLLGALLYLPWALWLGVPPLAVVVGGVVGAVADTLLGLGEDRFRWGNNLTNLLSTALGGGVGFLIAA